MFFLYNFGIVMMVCCVVIYYKIGDLEYDSGVPLAIVSACVWVITYFVLEWGKGFSLLAQFGIFVLITIGNLLSKKHLEGK